VPIWLTGLAGGQGRSVGFLDVTEWYRKDSEDDNVSDRRSSNKGNTEASLPRTSTPMLWFVSSKDPLKTWKRLDPWGVHLKDGETF
jgi:hypothetical protein